MVTDTYDLEDAAETHPAVSEDGYVGTAHAYGRKSALQDVHCGWAVRLGFRT